MGVFGSATAIYINTYLTPIFDKTHATPGYRWWLTGSMLIVNHMSMCSRVRNRCLKRASKTYRHNSRYNFQNNQLPPETLNVTIEDSILSE